MKNWKRQQKLSRQQLLNTSHDGGPLGYQLGQFCTIFKTTVHISFSTKIYNLQTNLEVHFNYSYYMCFYIFMIQLAAPRSQSIPSCNDWYCFRTKLLTYTYRHPYRTLLHCITSSIPATADVIHTVSISRPLPPGKGERGCPRPLTHLVGMTTPRGAWSVTHWSEALLATSRDPISILWTKEIIFTLYTSSNFYLPSSVM